MNHPMAVKRPFELIIPSEPSCIGPITDSTRSTLAFGNWAFPKLKRELKDPDVEVVRKAVYSISDIVHDPEITAQALHVNVIAEIQDLCRSDDELIRQGCALILKILAGQALGRESILDNPIALHNLSLLVEDPALMVRLKSSLAVARLAKVWMGAESLNDAGYVPFLLTRLTDEDPDIVSVHLETLKSLLDRDVKDEALKLGAMQIFAHLVLEERVDISSRAESCMALLAVHHDGKFMDVDLELLQTLEERLYNEHPAIHTKAAAAIMFITITTPSRTQAYELGFTDRLMELAYDSENPELQINCIKALTNIAEVPEGRLKLLTLQQTIKEIPVRETIYNESIKRHIETLLTVTRWKP